MQKRCISFLLLLMCTQAVFAQVPYPTDYFRSPVDTTLSLAGNFGEIRANHFHAGFDIRTNGKEGMPVYAAADGYISRIKISVYGYGKALYITHPNGYITVYGHLQTFDSDIQSFTKKVQYNKESFEIDTILREGQLPVKKGELIGLSGNTGGSQGPHLHFEIRSVKTEQPVNPYYFGYKVPDTIKPRITMIAVYPADDNTLINRKYLVKKIIPAYRKGKYTFKAADTLEISGDAKFGIECYDTENKSTNQNGPFSVELQEGGKRVYYHEMETFSFENARYVNAHIDYEDNQLHKTKIQKCFLAENNLAGIYKGIENNGIVSFDDDSLHWMKFTIRDFAGNETALTLKVRGKKPTVPIKTRKISPEIFDCMQENNFETPDIKIKIPALALYDDLEFKYSKVNTGVSKYSSVHSIQNETVALQKSIQVSIKSNNLPDSLASKACLLFIDSKGRKSYAGGKFEGGWVTTQTKNLGKYYIGIDTIAPRLKAPVKNQKDTAILDLRKATSLAVIARDDLSGIKKYRATVDGNWVICEYELKQDLLFYKFDETLAAGIHNFYLEVTDDKGNRSNLLISFKR